MDGKSEHPSHAVSSLIARSAGAFANGKMDDPQRIIHEGPGVVIYDCGEEWAELPKAGRALLNIHHFVWKDATIPRLPQLTFTYNLPHTDGGMIAEMSLDIVDADHFILVHRLVREQYRGNTIGTMLLQEVERWLGALAKTTAKDTTLLIPVAQLDLARWLLTNGYEADGSSQAILNKVLGHPERFDIEDIARSDNETGKNYIFPKGASEKTANTALRLHFKKIFSP